MDLLLVFLLQGFGDVGKQRRFARTWWGNDESALATSDGSHDIEHTGGVALGLVLEGDAAGGIDRLELVEMRELACGVGGGTVDGLQLGELQTFGSLHGHALDENTGAQTVFAHELRRHEAVRAVGGVVLGLHAEESKAFGRELEHAFDLDGRAFEFGGLTFKVATLLIIALAAVATTAVAIAPAATTIAVIVVIAVGIFVLCWLWGVLGFLGFCRSFFALDAASAFDPTHAGLFFGGRFVLWSFGLCCGFLRNGCLLGDFRSLFSGLLRSLFGGFLGCLFCDLLFGLCGLFGRGDLFVCFRHE